MRKAILARGVIALHDLFAVALVATILMAGFTAPALAYVDPSVMTYTIQALAGVAVALSAVAGVAFRRTRRAIFKLLNIDENARKAHDPAWDRTAPAAVSPTVHAGEKDFIAAAAGNAAAAHAAAAKARAERAAKDAAPAALPWWKRFLIALLAVGFPAFTVGIVAPYEIVAGNADALSYSLSDVAGILAVAVLAVTLVVALILSAFRGKAFRILAVIAVAGGLCFWVQAMFLNAGMPVMNGTAIDYWGQHGTMMVVSALVWLAILAFAVFAVVKKPRITQSVALVLAGALILVQGIGVATLFGQKDNNVFVTEDSMYDVTGKDVIVFVLDHFDTKFMYGVQEQFPEAIEELEGFTWYTDDSGMMVPTLFAVPYMLTGITPEPGQDIHDYYRTRYLDSTLIDDVTSTGYQLGLYTSDLQEGYFNEEEVQTLFADRTVNVHAVDTLDINKSGAVKILIRAALFRDMPWVAKDFFWFYTDALNQRVLNMNTVTYDAEGNMVLGDPANTPYIIDDVLRKTELEAFGLKVSNAIGTVKFIHFNGAHLPFTMDVHGNRVPQDSVTQVEQAAGALGIVGEYLQMMKDLGVYENATIIITADHGDWVASHDPTTMVSCPVMLVKQSGDTWSELRVSSKQISHANMIATVVEAVGADASKYGPTLAAAPETTVRFTYHITTIEDRVKAIQEFRVDGDANDMANWTLTGNEWIVEGGVAD